jgi:hypothetical protein
MQEQFAEKLPETPVPHRNAFRRLKKFRDTDSVLDAEVTDHLKFNDKKLIDISDSLL